MCNTGWLADDFAKYFVAACLTEPRGLERDGERTARLPGRRCASASAAFGEILAAWRCKLIESGGETDHVHLLIDIRPALDISVLINNLKTASARRARNRFSDHLAPFYPKPLFWSRTYFVGSVGGATLETVRAYVDARGTEEHARKSAAQKQTVRLTPSRSCRLRLWVRKRTGRARRGNALTVVQFSSAAP